MHSSMGLSRTVKIDHIVLGLISIAYYEYAVCGLAKPNVAKLIGAINWKYKGKNKHMLLMVPGRRGNRLLRNLVFRQLLQISVNLKQSVR